MIVYAGYLALFLFWFFVIAYSFAWLGEGGGLEAITGVNKDEIPTGGSGRTGAISSLVIAFKWWVVPMALTALLVYKTAKASFTWIKKPLLKFEPRFPISEVINTGTKRRGPLY